MRARQRLQGLVRVAHFISAQDPLGEHMGRADNSHEN